MDLTPPALHRFDSHRLAFDGARRARPVSVT